MVDVPVAVGVALLERGAGSHAEVIPPGSVVGGIHGAVEIKIGKRPDVSVGIDFVSEEIAAGRMRRSAQMEERAD